MNSEDVIILKKEAVYQGHFKLLKFTLQHRLFSGQWSATLTREVFDRGDAVCLLLYDQKQDAVVLVEQFRAGAIERESSPWLFEIVAGVIELGEQPEAVAIREAKEEAGIELTEVRPILTCFPSPGGVSEQVYLYYAEVDARGVSGVFGLASEQEDIKVHVVSRDTAYQWIGKGKIKNAMTILALQWLELQVREVRMRGVMPEG